MGGLEIDENSNVVGAGGAIKGLYAAGEVAGGLHRDIRLGRYSLLDCVVFGRLSGTNAEKQALSSCTELASPHALIRHTVPEKLLMP